MSKKFLLPFILCLALIALIIASVYLFMLGHQPKNTRLLLGGKPLAGTLYLTLQPQADPAKINISTLDLANQALKPLFMNSRLNVTPAFSPDGSKLVYASRGTAEAAYQLYGATTDGKQYFQLTIDANKVKREPVWSSDNKTVAYSVQSTPLVGTSSPNLLFPGNWLVFVTNLNKEGVFVGTGANPFFSPDGKTLFALQNDGLHGVAVAGLYPTGATTAPVEKTKPATFGSLLVPLPAGTPAPALKSMKISISHDGTKLAWSVPTRGVVHIYSVQSWSPLTLKLEKDLQTTALYSAFSPDGGYLALEQVTLDQATKKFVNPKIVIYSLADGASVQAADLSAYSVAFSGISSWR